MTIPVPDDILGNPLFKGRATRLSAEQVDYHPARSLTAVEVSSLEKLMLTDLHSIDK